MPNVIIPVFCKAGSQVHTGAHLILLVHWCMLRTCTCMAKQLHCSNKIHLRKQLSFLIVIKVYILQFIAVQLCVTHVEADVIIGRRVLLTHDCQYGKHNQSPAACRSYG